MHRYDEICDLYETAGAPMRLAYGARALRLPGCAFLLAAAAVALPFPVWAQPNDGSISQAVVQPLPPDGVTDLNSALRRLARNSRNVDALIDAGNASLKVDDVDAAIGFFGRAEELSPSNPRIKVGLAAAFTRKQRPLDALRLFDEAEQAGASTDSLASDRGLAYDLVGDNSSAQRHYRTALEREDDPQTRQRLALSHAMAGDRAGFESVLAPLIAKQDPASYRTRAFGLAILGEDGAAVAIAEAVMPRRLSSRIAPYLRYMPRLTKAQQAAAANLGVFPRAAQIGRDDPQIAQYADSPLARNADARLAPRGEPLGRREDTSSPRRRPDRGRSSVAATAPVVEATPPATTPAQLAQADVSAATTPPPPSAAVRPDTAQLQVTEPAANIGPSPGFDLAQVSSAEPAAQTTSPTPTVSDPVVQRTPESVADAFANFSLTPRTGVAPSTGSVDITTIEPPREVAAKPEPEPVKPAHPRRYWVQVATGKNVGALRFDWRRISRKAGVVLEKYQGFTTPWGQSNRLLAGPFDSSRAAQRAVTALKEKGLDSFTFTSPEGQEILALK